jgi:hypothetical protein
MLSSTAKMSPPSTSLQILTALAATLSVCACGDRVAGSRAPDAGDEASQDARTPDAATCFDVPAWASTCNALAFCGPLVPTTCASGPIAQPEGGSIADGTYELTQLTAYGCAIEDPATTGQTLQFMASDTGPGVFSVQGIIEQPPSQPITQTWLVSVELPSTLGFEPTCGGDMGQTFGYTATPSTLTLFATAPMVGAGAMVLETYTRQ